MPTVISDQPSTAVAVPGPEPAPPPRRSPAALVRGAVRGRRDDPAWVRPALLALLAGTALLYLWGLGASGWANAYYSAAVQAGSQSWKAWFFGSFDAANAITVDKTPAALWIMVLSARVFGVNAWSILVPQALMGVAAVGLLYATVRRWFHPAAALLAGAVLALSPVATLMFRFNNPDALLVLLLVAAAYATTRALEAASTRWIVLAGALVGFAFLAKMLQALLVVPPLALVYLFAVPAPVKRRLVQLLGAGAAMVGAAGWWIAIVELWPASSRPYIGGSQNNSVIELALGYNGLGRLTGEETGSVGGGRGWGETGALRLFNAEIGGQVSWLLPAALILLVGGLVLTARRPRTDRTRAALLLWGGWLLVTALVFSFMAGIFHAYYTVALAPAVGAVVGVGGAALLRARSRIWASVGLAAATVATAVWAYVLLGRSADWQPWLRPVVLVAGLVAAAALLAGVRLARRFTLAAAAVAVVAALAAPFGYSVTTAAQAHTGAIPSAGPAVTGGGPGGRPGGAVPGGAMPGGAVPGGAVPGGGPARAQAGNPPAGMRQRDGGTRTGPGGGGLLNAGTPGAEVVAALRADADSYTWVAASVGANHAAGYQLATGLPVLAIGGFNGSDPAPTLSQFQQLVAEKRIHWFVGGNGVMPADSGSRASEQILAWVAGTFTPTTVGGVTLYDLS